MSEGEAGGQPIRAFGVEVGFAAILVGLGALAVWDSLRLGITWGSDGPRAGFFPFLVGAILIAASIVVVARAVRDRGRGAVFVHVHELKLVASIAVPTAIYVAAVPFIGIYVASALLVLGFLRFIGGYGLAASAGFAVVFVAALFLVFERWFLIELPKGPLEAALGF